MSVEEFHKSKLLLEKQFECYENAKNLIDASERCLATDNPLPSIAYHLSLLALEEVGKSSMIACREASLSESGWMDRRLDNHIFKMVWALWEPSLDEGTLDPQKFENIQRISRSAHEKRLASLYVDSRISVDSKKARLVVDLEEAEFFLNLAKVSLSKRAAKGPINVDIVDDVQIWFFDTVSDEEKARLLFSQKFIAKFYEFEKPRDWIEWAKCEFARQDKEASDLLNCELARKSSFGTETDPRWRIRLRAHAVSHSIRAKNLSKWNDRIEIIQLTAANSGSLILDVSLGSATNVKDVFDKGLSLSTLFLSSLSIGSAGYFWFERPSSEKQYFESIKDLKNEKFELKVEQGRALEENWLPEYGKPVKTVLEESHLENAFNCLGLFLKIEEKESEPILRPYINGMALLSRGGFHLSFDVIIFQSFRSSLLNALIYFEDWDGKDETLYGALDKLYTPIIPSKEDRDQILSNEITPLRRSDVKQEHAVNAKRVTDLYLVMKARDVMARAGAG